VYLRHTVVRKGGRLHTYWRLVRSVRRGCRVVQETVTQLGELDAGGRARARLLAQELTGGSAQQELFEAAATAEQSIAVRLDRVRIERARSFGSLWLGWTLWRALRLDELCAELLPAGREAVPWAEMAAVLVIARLTEPASELHIAEDWYRTSALEDLLGLPIERVNDDRLYQRWIGCYRTNTNSLAARGYSRDQSARLQAGLHRAGGNARGDAARLRSIRRQPHRRDDRRRDRHDHGTAVRFGPPHLGNGPRHDQRRKCGVAPADRAPLLNRCVA